MSGNPDNDTREIYRVRVRGVRGQTPAAAMPRPVQLLASLVLSILATATALPVEHGAPPPWPTGCVKSDDEQAGLAITHNHSCARSSFGATELRRALRDHPCGASADGWHVLLGASATHAVPWAPEFGGRIFVFRPRKK